MESAVRVVVPAAVAVVVYPATKLSAYKFADESRDDRVDAVADDETPDPVGSPVRTGVVIVGDDPNTATPVPVSSVKAAARLADVSEIP